MQRCLSSSTSPLLLLPPLLLLLGVGHVLAGVCPGGKQKCPDFMTCCQLANYEYGCCTYPQAQCCLDRIHCCPHDMKCDVRHQACLKDGFPALFFTQVSIKSEPVEEEDQREPDHLHHHHHFEDTNRIEDTFEVKDTNTCPDGRKCPKTFTCCKMYRGNYGCCPYSSAKCCRDGFHCCPHGSQCDPVTGGCVKDLLGWLGKASSLIISEPAVPSYDTLTVAADPGGKCPDGYPCQDKFTCCQKTGGGYGCCPLSNAVCCTDHIHCCPQNTNCNTSTGSCDSQSGFSVTAHLLTTEEQGDKPQPHISEDATVMETEAVEYDANDICPDKRSRCNPGNTCCLMKDGSYGCCPFDHATCCSDLESCCPHGYRCADGGRCERLSTLDALPFLSPINHETQQSTVPSEDQYAPEEDAQCPDGSSCPDRTTCCSISTSRYGCCPYPLATCCGDMEHCCPHGYWCGDSGCERLLGETLNLTQIMPRHIYDDFPKVMLAP